jgi:preprotein translocase subunit SecA
MSVSISDILPLDLSDLDFEQMDREELKAELARRADELYTAREAELGEELMRALERFLLLQIIDNRWREHLYDMDYLREGIHLRGFAQIEPIVAYKNEAFTLFQDLMNTIWSDFARMVYHVEVEVQGNGAQAPAQQYSPSGSSTGGGGGRVSYSSGAALGAGAIAAAAASDVGSPDEVAEAAMEPSPVVQQRRVEETEQIGRNDPCWCGSGKKYKKCHGA